MKLPQRFQKNTERGLTFLELITVISIFAVMASIVLFRFDIFNSKITLNNLAQDIALRIVSAQKAALSGSVNPNFVSPTMVPTYGVFFETDSANGKNKEFTYFNDIGAPGNREYDGGTCPATPTPGSECISITGISTGEYISDICYVVGTGTKSCSAPAVGEAHITFRRPFPDAGLRVGAPSLLTSADTAYIELSSRDGTDHRTIIVTGLGKVSVFEGPVSAAP